MITGSAESQGTAGDSNTNADSLSFPPWTMAVTLRMGGMSWHWKHRLTYVCSASLHCNESVYVYECVCRCEILWETVKNKQARTPSEAEYRASPSTPPSHTLSDSSSFHLQSLLFPTAANARPISIHHAFIHFLSSHLSVLQSKASSGSAGNSVERWRKAKRNSVDQHLR